MAMNKKEQAEMERLKTDLLIAKAMRFTDKVEPDLMPPKSLSEGLVKGFLYNSYSPRVERSCTSSVHHSFGSDEETSTQNPKRLYSTELLAWKACRNEMEEAFARKLAGVDLIIDRLSKAGDKKC